MTERPLAMRDALLRRIGETMADDPKLFFVCADFGSPVLDSIRERFPERFVNVGIAEPAVGNDVVGVAEHADPVVVDDQVEVVKAVLAGEHRGFPVGAFVQLAVSGDDEDITVAAFPVQSKRHPGGDAEAVPERAIDCFIAGNYRVRDAAEKTA